MMNLLNLVLISFAIALKTNAQAGLACGSSPGLSIQDPADLRTNASASIKLVDPFRTSGGPFQNGSGNWTWTLATVSHNDQEGNGTVEQRMWLDVKPRIDLQASSLGFVGCGAIFHGLMHDQLVQGQDDDGHCNTILDDECRSALLQRSGNAAVDLSSDAPVGPELQNDAITAIDLCHNLAFLNIDNNQSGFPSQCSKYFTKEAWIQTFVFASPQASDVCSQNPGNGSADFPSAVWGTAPYSPHDMTSYDNLTTSVTPFMSVMFSNQTLDYAGPSHRDFAPQYLRCLRPSNISVGSVHPTGVPSSASTNPALSWLPLAALFVLAL